MSKKGDYLIPFNSKGDQLHYPEAYEFDAARGCGYKPPEWRPNAPFRDTLTFDTYSRGRSAAYFHFKRSDGTGVCMFLTDIEAAIPHMVAGKLTGTFRFTKRGQNYGVQLESAA